VLVAVSGSIAAGRLAARETVNDTARRADLLSDAVVQPVLRDGLLEGSPAAYRAVDRAVRAHVLGPRNIRVKLWAPDGRIVYSDEPRLVGKRFPLSEKEQSVFAKPVTRAQVSDLDEPENVYERGQGKLLEVYRPVWTPSGQPLLFETYAPYDGIGARASELRRGFAGITISSLLALSVLLVPVVLRLLRQIKDDQQRRQDLLERAVAASTDERRRIAGSLHDGVIQDLAGASLIVSNAAARCASSDQPQLAAELRTAAQTVRGTITSMRTLLVDIYPPNLETNGLLEALQDLVTGLATRDIAVTLELDPTALDHLDINGERLVYRVAHECLRNLVKHAAASTATVRVAVAGDDVLLQITDDGIGFDVRRAVESPPDGHFGLRVLADVVRDHNAVLAVASRPGDGTAWLLRVPGQQEEVPTRSRLAIGIGG
jgi:signal transduction histidine kinase